MQIIKEQSQAAHWYSADGQAQHTIIGKTTGKPRATTIADARKNGWMPSVTTVLKCLHKPALERWKIGQSVLACMTATRNPGEELDVFIDRVLNVEEQQYQEATAARDLGSDIHAAIETVLNGGQCSEELAVYVGPVLDALNGLKEKFGVKLLATETVLVGDGYAGMTDTIFGNATTEILVDFKATKSVPKGEPWSEHKLQLAAYAGTRSAERREIFNCYISTVELGKVAILDAGPWQPIFERQWKPLLAYWRAANNI